MPTLPRPSSDGTCLGVIEAAVGALGGEQYFVRSLFANAAAVDDNDTIGIADRCQPVRDDQCRPALGKLGQRLLDRPFRFGVERLPAGRKRQKLQLKIDEVLAKLQCELVPAGAAQQYARIKTQCVRSGVSLDDNDLWIASTAVV